VVPVDTQVILGSRLVAPDVARPVLVQLVVRSSILIFIRCGGPLGHDYSEWHCAVVGLVRHALTKIAGASPRFL